MIVKGKPFKPGERMRKILEDAVTVGNATARTISMPASPEQEIHRAATRT